MNDREKVIEVLSQLGLDTKLADMTPGLAQMISHILLEADKAFAEGAPNYYQADIELKAYPMTHLIIVRDGGKSPHHIAEEAKAALADVQKVLNNYKEKTL